MDELKNSARAAVTALLVVVALAALITVARAEPHQPTDPEQVLLRVAGGAESDEIAVSAQRYREAPTMANALQLAARHLARGRRNGEPRDFGRSEAILESWRARAGGSAEWHVLLADVHQYRHDYAPALELLDRALEIDTRQTRARLMRAAIRQTRGEFPGAQADCGALLAQGESALGLVCVAQVRSLTGQLDRAYALLQRQLAADGGRVVDAAIRNWMLGALADMADRRGDGATAERLLREALRFEPRDQFVRLTLADLLLAQGRGQDVELLLREQAPAPAVLLRQAEARAGAGEADALIEGLRRALADSGERGELVDGRDIVRLRLLENRGCDALVAARANWARQRESTDVRLLLVAARSCGDSSAAREIVAWRAATGYEDVRADALLAASSRPT